MNYKLALKAHSSLNDVLGNVLSEMTQMSKLGQDCWLSRVEKMEKLLINKPPNQHSKQSGKVILTSIKSKFERFWLDEVQRGRLGRNGEIQNIIRTYRQFKGTFGLEPYLTLTRNRNQRCF